MKSIFPLFVFVAVHFQAAAQSAPALEKAGDRAAAEKDWYTAFIHYRTAMVQSPDAAALWFKYAETARQFNAFEEAEIHFEKVCASEAKTAFPMAWLRLGQVRKILGKYEAAIEAFRQFLKLAPQMPFYTALAQAEIRTAETAMKMETEALVKVEHLDKKINSPYSEFGALEADGMLYFSSYRFDYPGDHHQPERKLSKVLFSEKKAKGKLLPNKFNAEEKLTAHTAISPDSSRMYYTVCAYTVGFAIRCEIFYRKKDKRGRWESQGTRLPDRINLKNTTATQPATGYDSLAKLEVLYFASDRPGGQGQMDIWRSEIRNGVFSEPENQTLLNTPENDFTPFFHTPTQTLYFSSDGRAGLGGYDIFSFSQKKEAIATMPAPVNSSYHDLYFSLGNEDSTAFLSSNRTGALYLDAANKACCYDIFQVHFLPEKINSLTPLPPAPPTLPQLVLPKTYARLEEFLPLPLYFDNDEPDKRTERTATKKTYAATFEKYYERKREYVEKFTGPLEEEAAAGAALELEDFFDMEVKSGNELLQRFSEILLKRLQNGDSVEIVIRGYTSPRAKTEYNAHLASRRISSVRNQFEVYENGAFRHFLQEKKLKISEAPLGELQAAGSISDDLSDERSSIYFVGAARERRVEIVEVR